MLKGEAMRNILIVDDETEIVEFLSNFLRRKNTKVFIATSGNQALELFKDNDFDLVLLDIGIPDIDGLKILEIVKRIDENLKVIMVTGKDDDESVIKAQKLGASDYITKPLELGNLYSVVSKHLKEYED